MSAGSETSKHCSSKLKSNNIYSNDRNGAACTFIFHAPSSLPPILLVWLIHFDQCQQSRRLLLIVPSLIQWVCIRVPHKAPWSWPWTRPRWVRHQSWLPFQTRPLSHRSRRHARLSRGCAWHPSSRSAGVGRACSLESLWWRRLRRPGRAMCRISLRVNCWGLLVNYYMLIYIRP